MVYSVASEERRGVAAELSMATNSERPAKLLHNFNLPFDLRWGNQRHLRCMKVDSDGEDDDAAAPFDQRSAGARVRRGESESGGGGGGSAAQFDRRSSRQPRRPRIGGEEVEEGIEAVREKLMFEFKKAADKMKDAILRGGEEMEVEEEQHEEVPANTDVAAVAEDMEVDVDAEAVVTVAEGGSSSPAAGSASASAAASAVRPWNLRTRRAACKAPLIGGGAGKGLRIEEKKANYSPLRSDVGGHHHHHHNNNNNGGGGKSPRPVRVASGSGSGSGSDSGPRPKFSLTLTKKEIEEDFIQMLGHRPPRRPKKRPRAVQRQLDALFPGTWLTEVTPDSYKVPEFPENVKR